MTQKLTGKIAVITGGTTGIGLATAKRFAAEGAFVYVTGRRQAELDAAVAQLAGNGAALRADSTNPADLDRLYEGSRPRRAVSIFSSPMRGAAPCCR